ncbi:hypothetical protein LC065_08330 [Halobacillus litoralis]|uniref:hypothetical protein n=1 Tax=Halobacillus litoralis TaxID=45668 RepID=UPI001CFDD255|nr:hypothetical protein [Halobacillus litoralis]WLR49153.1 hypothetical protein LC065_08330 [Halobacillus litoralis]
MLTKVGEHTFEFYGDMETVEKLYGAFIHKKSQTRDMGVFLESGFGKSFDSYEVTHFMGNGWNYLKRTDFLIEFSLKLKTAKIQYFDELALKHAFMTLYSTFITEIEWGLLVHSSCMTEGEVAHLFAGESGAGKSTVAHLSSPRVLLSDEAAILKVEDTGIKVFDSPFRSDQASFGVDKSFPLASIDFLNQAQLNQREPLKDRESLIEMMDKVFSWYPGPLYTLKLIKLIKLTVKQVPVYNLYFKKDPTFWELIS